MYPLIRAAAYEIDPAYGPWTEDHHVLRFGDSLQTHLMDLYRTRSRRRRQDVQQQVTLPIRGLNSLLRAAAPGVVAIGRGAAADPDLPWIHALESVPADVVVPLLATWVTGWSRGYEDDEDSETQEELLDVSDLIEAELPHWLVESVDLGATTTSAAGTAEPSRRLFSMLPEWIAARLATREFRVGSSRLAFRIASRDQGAEMVSWPPQRYVSGRQTSYYSARITITVQTVPFTGSFRIHVATGIRRWATGAEARPQRLRGATVFLDAPLPWLDGDGRTNRLIENSIGYHLRLGRTAWRRHSIVDLLPELDVMHAYPAPEDLLASPERWINGREGIAAGIVYSTAMGKHRVKAGLMPLERAELDAWVEEGLRPMLRRVPDLQRVTRLTRPVLLPGPGSIKDETKRAEVDERRCRARRETLTASLAGDPLEIEILWQSTEVLNELVASLPRLLGLPPAVKSGRSGWRWQFEGLDIRLQAKKLGRLGEGMKLPKSNKGSRATALASAISIRRAAVAKRLGRSSGAVALAIVEIGGESRFSASGSDPKHALRLGCADTGRVSQFINIPEDSSTDTAHRSKWTWLDALRQLGAVVPPECKAGPTIPKDLQYVALWLVRHTGKGPTWRSARRLVALRVRPQDKTHPVCGWDDVRQEWVPYPQLLLALARDGAPVRDEDVAFGPQPSAAFRFRTEREWQDDSERRIRTMLFGLRGRPTLLLASTGNLRQCWPRLGNAFVAKDMLSFGGGPDQRLATYGQDLRFVLARDDNGRDEVPEWYAHDGEGEVGFGAGVWGLTEADSRVFASTTDKPPTSGQAKGVRKLLSTETSRVRPTVNGWNPRYLELTVLGCLSEKALADVGREGDTPDNPVDWAALVHQLRLHNDYAPLARPLPLHLARLAGQYVLPLARIE